MSVFSNAPLSIGRPLWGGLSIACGFAVLCLLFAVNGMAQQSKPPQDEPMTIEQFLASLDMQQGTIELPGGKTRLELPAGFRYLSPRDTERVLVDAWGNPPGSGEHALGMLFPLNPGLFDDLGWAVIISYEEDGHVLDDDAENIDYGELLEQMQQDTRQSSEQRRQAGYPGLELIGWATPPRYDGINHKLYWAKRLRSDGAARDTLNYNVRALGRKGVLVLNIIADINALNKVEATIPSVLAMADFTEGNRYADFNPDIDEVAAYGIGALVAGKLAAKAGLFAKLGVMLLALKKLWIPILIGVVAVGRWLYKRRKKSVA